LSLSTLVIIVKSHAANIIKSGTINLSETDTITIPASNISKLGTEEIELPIMTNDVNTDELVHTARSSSACFPVFQCTLSAA
jgi:hypothetical protein